MCVIGRLELLDVDNDNGNVKVSDGGKDVIGRGVCEHLQKHKVHISRAELIPRNHGLFFGCYHPAVNDLDRIGKCFFERLVLRLEFGHEGGKLRKICAQRNRKYADSGFCVY